MLKGYPGFPTPYHLSPVGSLVPKPFRFQYLILGDAGVSIRQRASSGVTLRDLLDYATQALILLERIHNKGFFYGDLHTENIMLKGSTVYLVDFGRTDTYIHNITSNEEVILKRAKKFQFLSPWELSNNRLSRRDDIFRLAEMIVRLLPQTKKEYLEFVKNKDQSTLAKAKLFTNINSIIPSAPKNVQALYEYARNMSFTEPPDYMYIRQLLS